LRSACLTLAMIACAAGSAAAAPLCYEAREIEADQAVQFQTELMVLSNACRTPSYTNFTQRNRLAIIDYQGALMARFRRAGEHHADLALETYLTHLANETALRQGGQAPDQLCAQSASLLSAAETIGADAFHALAAHRAATHAPAYPRCGD
jgi:hypothetical protein